MHSADMSLSCFHGQRLVELRFVRKTPIDRLIVRHIHLVRVLVLQVSGSGVSHANRGSSAHVPLMFHSSRRAGHPIVSGRETELVGSVITTSFLTVSSRLLQEILKSFHSLATTLLRARPLAHKTIIPFMVSQRLLNPTETDTSGRVLLQGLARRAVDAASEDIATVYVTQNLDVLIGAPLFLGLLNCLGN